MVTIEDIVSRKRKNEGFSKSSSSSKHPPPLSLNKGPSPSSALASLLSGKSSESDFSNQAAAAQRLAAALHTMKVPSMTLPSGPLGPLPFSPELLWRYPNPFLPQPPPSPLEMHLRTQLPGSLSLDPRSWSREDVTAFLRYCEREFDLDKIEMDKFVMNGKALCLLNKNDLAERCAGAGDVIHNILQMLLREHSTSLPPSSPLTPRHLTTPNSPVSSPLTHHQHPWPLFTNSDSFPNLSHLIHQTNSVTLSPAPSLDSSNGSPKLDGGKITSIHQLYPPQQQQQQITQQHSQQQQHGRSISTSSHSDSEDSDPLRSPSSTSKEKSEESPLELNTNGRLLWDFLQQLLNDSTQRYTSYINWKNKETGVFKIVDPAGLAKLWGIQKNHLSMNYDKMSRALRYYYRVNILRKVQGERHCYQFLRNPTELKSIKNISLLRQQIDAAAAAAQKNASSHSSFSSSNTNGCSIKTETFEDEPTDLSLDADEKAIRNQEHRERFHVKHEDEESENDFRRFGNGTSIKSEHCS